MSIADLLEKKAWFDDLYHPPDKMDLPDQVDGPWLEEKGLLEVYQAVQALDKKNQSPLFQVKQLIGDWQAWRERMEPDLVYPPTAENTAWVLKRGLKECPMAIFSLALAYPRWTILLLKKYHPETMKEFKNGRGWVVQFYQSDPGQHGKIGIKNEGLSETKLAQIEKPVDLSSSNHVSSMKPAVDQDLSPFKQQLMAFMADAHQEDVAIVRERLDGLLKMHRSQLPELTLFFETIEVLARLKDEKLSRIAEVWPSHFQFRIDPESWMGHPRFWVALKPLVHQEEYFISVVMPKLIDSKDWDTERRYDLFVKINQHHKDRLNWFKQRFKLWSALGGDIDQKFLSANSKDQGENCFLAASPTSVRQWIENQHQPDWIKVIPSRFVRRSQP